VGVEFIMTQGSTTEGTTQSGNCQETEIKNQTLTQATFAVNARPAVDTAVVGTHKKIIVKYDSPASVATTGSTTVTSYNATTLNVIYFAEDSVAALEAAGIPGKVFDKDKDGDYTDTTCALQINDETSCVDCGANGFVNVAALANGAAYVAGSVSAGST